MNEKIETAIEQYAPILHFHPKEGEFCCYPSDASLIYNKFSDDWSKFKVDMTPKSLNQETPCYYENWLSEEMIQFRYWFWYNYNRFPGSIFGKGNHLGDWEHVEVRLYYDSQDDDPIVVWLLSNHLTALLTSRPKNYTLGEFVPEQSILTQKHIHTWVALGSHAHYPSPDSKPVCYAKIFCDKIADNGEVWNTQQNLVPLRDTIFFSYKGRWGDEKAPRSPTNSYNNRWRNTSERELKLLEAVPEN